MTVFLLPCSKCGTENAPGSKSCSFCGTPFSASFAGEPTRIASGPGDDGPRDMAPGDFFAGRYHLASLLGKGGMGEVYLARDRKMNGRQIALKLMSGALVRDESARKRFIQEVEASQSFRHENIVMVYHLDESGGRDYFTMAYVAGRSLRALISERTERGGQFTPEESAAILMPVLSALSLAHGQGIIHRDLKPENIIVEGDLPDVRVKVLDFGLARIMSPSRMTSTAVAMGTAYYMAPEQLSGSGEADERSDVYSAGVVLYELLTGKIPSGRFKLPAKINADLPGAIDDVAAKDAVPVYTIFTNEQLAQIARNKLDTMDALMAIDGIVF